MQVQYNSCIAAERIFEAVFLYCIKHNICYIYRKKGGSRMGEAAAAIVSQQYKPRSPQQSHYYRCVEDHFESFELGYYERFSARYGFLRHKKKRVLLKNQNRFCSMTTLPPISLFII